jgi:hypothetical protein
VNASFAGARGGEHAGGQAESNAEGRTDRQQSSMSDDWFNGDIGCCQSISPAFPALRLRGLVGVASRGGPSITSSAISCCARRRNALPPSVNLSFGLQKDDVVKGHWDTESVDLPPKPNGLPPLQPFQGCPYSVGLREQTSNRAFGLDATSLGQEFGRAISKGE